MKKIVLNLVISIILILVLGGLMLGCNFSVPSYEGKITDHFDGNKFHNIGEVYSEGFGGIMKIFFTEKRGPWENRELLDSNVVPPANSDSNEIRITFINHSTFLIQFDSVNIITDPIWAERTSPVSFVGPARYIKPGVKLENIPKIDIILLSHNHYDHLDLETMKYFSKRDNPKIYTPLGNSKFLNECGMNNATDLDWWDSSNFSNDLKITCVPAQHFSGRGIFDRDKTLWGGFVINYQGKLVYFVGDTGYGDFIKQIQEKYTYFDLAIIPIGAYKPNWFMKPVHLNPKEAIQMHKDINSKQSIACHFGTFPLAWDGMDEPINDFNIAAKENNLNKEEFLILNNGGNFILK